MLNVDGPGMLSRELTEDRERLLEMLTTAYWMEIETVMNYVAGSTNPDGLRAQEIVEALEEDVAEELGHAQRFAKRIKELYGIVPGSQEFRATQATLQPAKDTTDLLRLVTGVIDAEDAAIGFYREIIEFCDGRDWVTQDMVIDILRDEEHHRRLFDGFLRELRPSGKRGDGAAAARRAAR